MLVLTNKSQGLRQVSKLPEQQEEISTLYNLKTCPSFEIVFEGIETKSCRYYLKRASEASNVVYVVFSPLTAIPWWIRSIASRVELDKTKVLEKVNKLKKLMEGALNYADLFEYLVACPIEELVSNCAELGLCKTAIVRGLNKNLLRKYIIADVIGTYLKSKGEQLN